MRAYMAYSRSAGNVDGAILVFHNTAKAARGLAWQSGQCLNVDEWTDLAVKWLRDETIYKLGHLDLPNTPHVICSPAFCEACELWGCGITIDDKCGDCGEYPGDELIAKLKGA